MPVYTLKRKNNTQELHLFEGEMTSSKECDLNPVSICNKVNQTAASGSIFVCKTAQETREKCAQMGRSVCGTCISHLYATYK